MTLSTPEDLKYLKTDQWIRIEGDIGTIGITDFAQDQLNDIVYVELPDVGKTFAQRDQFGVVESIKSTNDLFMPLAGEVVETNSALEEEPELVNDSPYDKGWMIKIIIANAGETDSLLSSEEYIAWSNER